jgi:hypothetical protein
MAGFFRDIGLLGVNFKEANTSFHVFDDNAFVAGEDLTKYYGTWSKTGFIRSSLDDGVNDLIATEDVNRVQKMFEIVRRAPEAKSCLTRRLAEYVLGEDQSFDGRWLKSFESRLEDSSTSGLAIKSVLSDLVLSNTFKVADPASDQCYDYLTEQSEGESIPCEVSFIVEKNCAASCHKSASSDNGQLSLSEWVPAAIDGTDSTNPLVRSFKHLDENGAQRSKKDTFTSILDRINSSDPDRAMPLAKEMPSVEKVRLFNWLEDEMER